jgi:hypothetical protein
MWQGKVRKVRSHYRETKFLLWATRVVEGQSEAGAHSNRGRGARPRRLSGSAMFACTSCHSKDRRTGIRKSAQLRWPVLEVSEAAARSRLPPADPCDTSKKGSKKVQKCPFNSRPGMSATYTSLNRRSRVLYRTYPVGDIPTPCMARGNFEAYPNREPPVCDIPVSCFRQNRRFCTKAFRTYGKDGVPNRTQSQVMFQNTCAHDGFLCKELADHRLAGHSPRDEYNRTGAQVNQSSSLQTKISRRARTH